MVKLYLCRQMNRPAALIKQMNNFGKNAVPFVFLIDFLAEKPMLFELSKIEDELFWKTPESEHLFPEKNAASLQKWKIDPVDFMKFSNGFNQVLQHIHNGDTYLLNFTQPTNIETNLSLEELFTLSSATYKIYLPDQFVCFSPESFVKIIDMKIFSFPMKGTIDAGIANADQELLNDSKEIAEHNTIVDLIRNDLSLVAENVTVDKFRYLSHIQTNRKNLWQVSSQISGDLPSGFAQNLGDIIFTLLPAGSVSGAPKKKTVEIINKTEKYVRGYYTGIFGIFDGKNLDSCVLIRYIENQNGRLVYKSGGGITFLSEAEKEYEELIKKVYVPVI